MPSAHDGDVAQLLSADDVAALHFGMNRFGMLVFRDQRIDDEQQVAFSRSLGPWNRPPAPLRSHENVIIGNTVLYGATFGWLFAAGIMAWSFQPSGSS